MRIDDRITFSGQPDPLTLAFANAFGIPLEKAREFVEAERPGMVASMRFTKEGEPYIVWRPL